MKILHVSSYGDVSPCGIADYTRDLIDSLNRNKKSQVSCGIVDYTGNLIATLNDDSIDQEVFTLPISSDLHNDEKKLDKLYSEIIQKSEGFDIVHIQHEFSFFKIRKNYIQTLIDFFKFVKKLKSKKVFITFHTEPLFYKNQIKRKKLKLSRFFYKLKLRYKWRALIRVCKGMNKSGDVRYSFVIHNLLAENSILKLGFTRNCIHRMFLPVKKIVNQGRSEYYQSNLNKFKGQNDILLGAVGFIDTHKGTLELLETLKVLPDNYKLVLCGGQHLRNESLFLETVREKIHNTPRLVNRVLITGYIEEEYLHYYLNAIDIFVYHYHSWFPSSSAAIGVACQAKKPIIASKVACFKEIANVYKCFELINCQVVHELAFTIKRITEDPLKSNELIEKTENFVRENNWDVAAQKFLGYYGVTDNRFYDQHDLIDESSD